MAPSRLGGGMAHSSSSSGIFLQGDEQSQPGGNTHLTSKIGNSTNLAPGNSHPGAPVSGDISNTTLNSVATSGPSMGASSLVTDGNSGLSGAPQFQRNASFNNESCLRLPASPLSFSSNNISISGSSVIDGASVVQQSSNQDLSSEPVRQGQRHQVTSSATSHIGQMQLPNGSRNPGSFMQDSIMSQLQKKPRLDIKQEDVLQQQVLQQYMQRQDLMHLQSPNPHLQALYQQERLRQQQEQLLQSMPPMQRAKLMQQHQLQLHLRQQLQQQGVQPSPAVKNPYDGGVCSRRIMQYLYHQRQRPRDNSIAYWRKFVAEYYSPRAKKRWCLSQYDNVGNQSLGTFFQSAMGASLCDICGSKSGRGYAEATYEVLPRLYEIKFGSGVIDELLYLDLPRECRMPSGMMMLEYAKAVQESVYEQLRVVREGQLRIIFSADLKILCWEFCARRHEELLPRRVIAPQVNQILQVAQKCQSTISESGTDGISQQDMQHNNNLVVEAGRQLAKTLESQSLNDLDFWKRCGHCLQIAEVVNSMKDLMDFCKDHKVGPIEGLQNFPSHATSSNINAQKMQKMNQHGGMQSPTDWNTHNKLMSTHPGLANNQSIVGRPVMNGSAQASLALTGYQNMLARQSSMNSKSIQQEPSPSFIKSSPSSSSSCQDSGVVLQGNSMNFPISGISNPHLQQQQHLQRLPSSCGLLQQNPQNSNGNQLQQQMMQHLLQDMSNNNKRNAVQQQSLSGQSGSLSRDGLAFSNGTPVAGVATQNGPGNSVARLPSRNNSFQSVSNSESLAGASNTGFNYKAPDVAQNFHMSDEMLQDMHGFFNNESVDNTNYGWKV